MVSNASRQFDGTHVIHMTRDMVIIGYALQPFPFSDGQRPALIVVNRAGVFPSRSGRCEKGRGPSIRVDPSGMAFVISKPLFNRRAALTWYIRWGGLTHKSVGRKNPFCQFIPQIWVKPTSQVREGSKAGCSDSRHSEIHLAVLPESR
jgi:hypothetical protein